jgi:hypothetical protein
MKSLIVIFQLLGGLVLLFSFAYLVGRILKLDKHWENMQKEKLIRNNK